MVNERAIAYSEVYAILKRMDQQYIDKIPRKLKNTIIEEMDKNYKPQIDSTVPLKEQNLNSKTYTILAMINLNYWCENEEHKNELILKYNENEQKYQEELRKKYNPDNIFKNKNNYINSIEKMDSTETAIVECKENNFVQKLFNKIKKLFRRKN